MRLGVFGGTFDPVHNGHVAAAVNARHAFALDRVLVVLAPVVNVVESCVYVAAFGVHVLVSVVPVPRSPR